jgi:hypothetical protein
MHHLKPYLLEIAISTLFYVGFFYFNSFIDQQIEVNRSVSWFFMPAGLRVFFSLIFIYTGSIGLFLASLIINYVSYSDLDSVTTLGIAVISGLAPLLSRLFVINHFQVHPNLKNITTKQLLNIIIIFALFSSGLHQVWFITRDLDTGSWNLFVVMFCGDVIGSIVFLYIIKYGVAYLRERFVSNNSISKS